MYFSGIRWKHGKQDQTMGKEWRTEKHELKENSGCHGHSWVAEQDAKRAGALIRSIKLLTRIYCRTSLVAQWLRIRLPMQGTRVWALVREDPTCHGATKPVRHNYWACVLQLLKTAREATAMRSPHTARKSSPRSPQLEKAWAQQQQRPNTAINK